MYYFITFRLYDNVFGLLWKLRLKEAGFLRSYNYNRYNGYNNNNTNYYVDS